MAIFEGRTITQDEIATMLAEKTPSQRRWEASRMTADEIVNVIKERDCYREALEIIAGEKQCLDNLLSNADIARITLSKRNPVIP